MPDSTHVRSQPEEPTPPRAFVTTTGFVLQIVGLISFLTGTGYWFVSGRVQRVTSVSVETLGDYFNTTNVALTITTINVLAAVAGGLALVAFGIGLQGERRHAGTGAMITTGILSIIGLAGVASYIVFASAWLRAGLLLLATGVHGVLFLLTGHSAAILKRHPPPADANEVDDAWIEEHRRSRRSL